MFKVTKALFGTFKPWVGGIPKKGSKLFTPYLQYQVNKHEEIAKAFEASANHQGAAHNWNKAAELRMKVIHAHGVGDRGTIWQLIMRRKEKKQLLQALKRINQVSDGNATASVTVFNSQGFFMCCS